MTPKLSRIAKRMNSTSLSSQGTIASVDASSLGTVITPEQQPPVETIKPTDITPNDESKSKPPGRLDYGSIPYVSVSTIGCCGVGVVDGIQLLFARDMNTGDYQHPIEKIFASFEKARRSNKDYGDKVKKKLNEVSSQLKRDANGEIVYTAELLEAQRGVYAFRGKSQYCGMYFITYHSAYTHIGEAMAKYITENRLGSVTITPQTYNPNSHNHIYALCWSVDYNNWRKKVYDWFGDAE